MKAVGFDPVKIREDAKRVLTLVKESTLSEEEFLASLLEQIRQQTSFEIVLANNIIGDNNLYSKVLIFALDNLYLY